MTETRKNNRKTRHNWWKWAFIILVVLIVGSIGYVVHQVSAPVEKQTTVQPLKTSNSSFQVKLNSTQVNALAANYLTRLQKNEKTKYKFVVGKKYATITGSTKFLGFKLNFALNFIPQRLSDGNVLLNAKGLSVGRLNIPIKYVMGYIKNHYKLPNWVKLNQKKKTILLDMNKYSKHRNLHYSAEEINLQQGTFRFLVTVPKLDGGND